MRTLYTLLMLTTYEDQTKTYRDDFAHGLTEEVCLARLEAMSVVRTIQGSAIRFVCEREEKGARP
jgi:hypothetical protein